MENLSQAGPQVSPFTVALRQDVSGALQHLNRGRQVIVGLDEFRSAGFQIGGGGRGVLEFIGQRLEAALPCFGGPCFLLRPKRQIQILQSFR